MAEESNLPVPQTGGAMARPSFLPANDHRGAETITQDDIQMPRLGLAQALSPQIEDGNPKQILDLKSGQLFNSLTQEIYGKGPMFFTVIRADKPRFIEFNPRSVGGGIKDFDVAANDPRTQFTTDEQGKSVPPLATKFYDFIILMLPFNELDPMSSLIALSLKSTGLKVARQLNGLIKLRNAASFAGKYSLKSGTEKNTKGTFNVYQISNAGWVDEKTFKLAGEMHKSLASKTVVIEREPGDDDPGTDFPTDEQPATGVQM